MKFLFTAFGLHNPYLSIPTPDHAILPLSKSDGERLDLDYTALMLGNTFFIDETAFNYVLSLNRQHLKPMQKSLRRLHSENILKTIDYSIIIKDNKELIDKKLDILLEDIRWFRIVQNQWALLKNYLRLFHEQFGDKENEEANITHTGILHCLNASGDIGRETLKKNLEKLLSSKKANLSKGEKEFAKEITKPLVAQILINNLIRTKLEIPFLDWDDAAEFYEHLWVTSFEPLSLESNLLKQSQQLFNIIVPDLKPNNIDAVVSFINDKKSVSSLRDTLINAINRGEKVSEIDILKYINMAIQKSIIHKNKMKKFQFACIVSSVFPIPGLSSLCSAVDFINNCRTPEAKGLEWYYTLQSNLIKSEKMKN